MKLIIINGPTGIGKSTIAKKIHDKLPLSFLLDIDAQRRHISNYRENRKESGELSFVISRAIVDEYLKSGHDVVIDKTIINTNTTLNKFVEIGEKHNADIYEFILNSSKETLLKRAEERGYKDEGLLTPEKVAEFWEAAQEYIKNKPEAVVIDTKNLDADGVFKIIVGHIFK